MKPSVGRVVHYTNLGDKDGKFPPEEQAAIVTSAKLREGHLRDHHDDGLDHDEDYDVTLAVLYKTGMFFVNRVFTCDSCLKRIGLPRSPK